MTDNVIANAQESVALNTQPTQQNIIAENINSEPIPQRSFTQEEVNRLVGSNKLAAAERARKEAYAEFQNYASSNQASSAGDVFTRDDIARIVSEENEKASRMAVAQKIARDFVTKIEASKEKYPDIGNAIGKLELTNNPELVDYVTTLDNTADVVYELSKNGLLRGSIMGLLSRNPNGARDEIINISNSLKSNKRENFNNIPNPPLSQINPSISGVDGDSESPSIRDFTNASWLRG